MQNSKILHFDDYDFDGPEEMIDWVDKGANYDEWNLAPLIAAPVDYIVLDFPFAYKHSKTSELIDFTVYIDTPLDIAMARRVIRDFKNSTNESILNEMENYLLQGRRAYLEMIMSIKPNSDLIVEGTLTASKIVDKIHESLLKR